jgi:hypothetical protein
MSLRKYKPKLQIHTHLISLDSLRDFYSRVVLSNAPESQGCMEIESDEAETPTGVFSTPTIKRSTEGIPKICRYSEYACRAGVSVLCLLTTTPDIGTRSINSYGGGG